MEMDKRGMQVMTRGKGERKGWIIWILQQKIWRGEGLFYRWIKDHDFGWGMTWDDGEQLSWRPGGKNEIEESMEGGSTGGKKEE